MNRPVIEVKGLRTWFNTPEGIARAVDGISFSIDAKETFALVGESGCGKSVTALSVIQLVPEPTGFISEGEILLDGKDIVLLTEVEKRRIRGNSISMIFQEPMTSLNPVFTVGNQIAETITLHQKKNAREARTLAIEMLERVGLPEPVSIYDEYPHRLSGGMRQRVMIAIALACRPRLLIADEPTTALDVTIQDQILKLMKELGEEMGTAVLLITHNLALVFQNAQNVGVMYAGKIVEQAPTKLLFRNPMHPYTLKLLRSIPTKEKRGGLLDTIPGTVPMATAFVDGCRFSGRCAREMQGCATMEPELAKTEERHLVACHLFDPSFMSAPVSKPIQRPNEEEKPPPSLTVPLVEREPLLEIKGLKMHYPVRKGLLKKVVGHVKAVDGIDMTIRRGSTLALVGESGCGKTTVGKAILQLLRPTAGEVVFKGTALTTLAESRLKPFRRLMQVIFQDPYSSLNPRMVVGEIIQEGLITLRPEMDRAARQKQVALTLERVGLDPEMARRYPHEFSGGQRQRIAIARALTVDPEFIVCDEAVSALDVSVQAQILNLLKSIQRDLGLSFLFITHDLGVVEYIADEVCVMFKGKIVERGTVDEIFSNPAHEYTRTLLKAIPRIEGGVEPTLLTSS